MQKAVGESFSNTVMRSHTYFPHILTVTPTWLGWEPQIDNQTWTCTNEALTVANPNQVWHRTCVGLGEYGGGRKQCWFHWIAPLPSSWMTVKGPDKDAALAPVRISITCRLCCNLLGPFQCGIGPENEHFREVPRQLGSCCCCRHGICATWGLGRHHQTSAAEMWRQDLRQNEKSFHRHSRRAGN